MTKQTKVTAVTPIVALLAGLAVALAVLSLTTGKPLESTLWFFSGPFASRFSLGSWLNRCALLCFTGIGASIAFVSGNFNLGGEGQVYASGFVTALVLNAVDGLHPVFALAAACAASLLTGGFLGAFSGLLKVTRGINELLTSFLVSGALIPLIDYGIAGRFRDQEKNLLATPLIDQSYRLASVLPPSRLNISFFLALLLCAAVFACLYKTRSGYRFRMCGKAPEFARFCGFSPKRATVGGMFVSGVLHGLCGFFAVAGTYFACYSGFYSGFGWNGLTVALIAASNPLAVIPAALILSYLLTASDQAVLVYNLPFDVSGLIAAAVLFCITARFVITLRKKKAKPEAAE